MLSQLLTVVLLAAVSQNALDSGQSALQAGDLVRAEQLFRQYLSEHPQSAEALSNLGAICARRGQFSEAADYYGKALKANPGLVQVHFNMAVSLGQLKQYVPAAQHLRTFLKSYPNHARGLQLLGLCLIESGDPRAALKELDASYKADARDPSILFALAYANARAGDENRAADILKSVESNPAQARLIEGLIEYRRGRFEEAKALFQEVLRINPDVAPAAAAIGRLELLEHHDAEAIRMLERALQLNPSDAESTYQLGVLLDRNGRTPEGIRFLRRALTLRANYADPHYQLGRIAFDAGDYAGAIASLEEARRLLPDQEAIRFLLGRTYQAAGRTGEAKIEFAEVRRLKAAVIERDRQRVESDELMKSPPVKPQQ
jgi:tetratricopeptide (TPR) repeat protein